MIDLIPRAAKRRQRTAPLIAASNFKLHPQQLKAYLTRATEVLYGGAAGGGKSHLLRMAAILFCIQIPGLQVYLFRRISHELYSNHMEGPRSFPMLLADMVANGMCRIRARDIMFWNGAKIHLRHCQYEKNVYSYQGAEIHLLLIDELTHWTENMYTFLRGRCRVVGKEIKAAIVALGLEGQFPKIICGTNPGGIGHHWVKKNWVDRGLQAWQAPAVPEGGMIRRFIPAKIQDNPTLLEDDPHYIAKLQGLGDPLLVRAMLTGDWKIVAGAMFGSVWREVDENGAGWHVIDPFPIPSGWELWRGADDGFGEPAAMYHATRDPDFGTFYIIKELYERGMSPEEFSEKIHRYDRSIAFDAGAGAVTYNQQPLDGMLDSNAFADHGTSDRSRKGNKTSRGAQMNELGCRWKSVDKWPGSRVQGVQNIHRLLLPNPRHPLRRPGVQIFNVCTNLIRTLPTLPRDKNKPEDIDDGAEDHPFDGLRYTLQKKIARRKREMEITGY